MLTLVAKYRRHDITLRLDLGFNSDLLNWLLTKVSEFNHTIGYLSRSTHFLYENELQIHNSLTNYSESK